LCEVANKREAKERAHERRVINLYGLKPGDYAKLLKSQGGYCAIRRCKARGVSRALAVEHNHKLGFRNRKAVRGLMCKTHNKWIGMAGDDPEVFDSIAEYLRDPPAQKVLTDDLRIQVSYLWRTL
jgi:Recombination endonuclease VII